MDRDWDAEWDKIEAEYYAAKKALDAAHRPVSPALIPKGENTTTKALAAFGAATQRFDIAKARWSTFLAERKHLDPTWSA